MKALCINVHVALQRGAVASSCSGLVTSFGYKHFQPLVLLLPSSCVHKNTCKQWRQLGLAVQLQADMLCSFSDENIASTDYEIAGLLVSFLCCCCSVVSSSGVWQGWSVLGLTRAAGRVTTGEGGSFRCGDVAATTQQHPLQQFNQLGVCVRCLGARFSQSCFVL